MVIWLFWIRNVYSYRNNVLICYLSLAHKSLFTINKIEILFICSNKIENNTIVLFILDTGYWEKARWGGRWSHLWDSEEGSRELLQVRSFITSNISTKHVAFLILPSPTIKAIFNLLKMGLKELFCSVIVVVAHVLFINRIKEEEKRRHLVT